MLFYTLHEMAGMLLAAILIDWIIGDPKWPTHPVIYIGRLIKALESKLHGFGTSLAQQDRGTDSSAGPSVLSDERSAGWERFQGIMLAGAVTLSAFAVMFGLIWLADAIHPWLGYAVNTWFISTTIAIKGLKDAALAVYRPLRRDDLPEARKWVGYIVGRNTSELTGQEVSRAAVETVAENIVDAVVSPLFFAFLGAAPLAMFYRAANTLDSMVGYKNDRYRYFGWASARLDDVLNWIPARLTGGILVLCAWMGRGLSPKRSFRSIRTFARLHPSPNSGFPESAVAGALGIQLGGVNVYSGVVQERARMGWPLRPLEAEDILRTSTMLYHVSYLLWGGLLCLLAAT